MVDLDARDASGLVLFLGRVTDPSRR
jgi:hypothetical protein